MRMCRQHGIAVVGFSSFGGASYVDIGMAEPADSLLASPCVVAIASKHGKTAAQVLLRWAVQRGTAVIPKTQTPERMLENLNVFDFALDSDDMHALAALNCNLSFCSQLSYLFVNIACVSRFGLIFFSPLTISCHAQRALNSKLSILNHEI